ncbi:MAG TPA: hypothetical protein ENJ18_07150 [Nannocystis exedens]|nr:hypothetical protein [Nannocystis exedens]
MTEILRQILVGEQGDLLPLALTEMQSAGFVLPPELLPTALACAKEQRPLLRPLLGARGRWLAAQNPAWAWAEGRAEVELSESEALRIFAEASLAERRQVLLQVRRRDPASARVWLADVWRGEKAEVRRTLLAVLEVHLGPDDEAFLEAALGDRSAVLRRQAAGLLRRIDGSAYGQRMSLRAAPCIRMKVPDIVAKLRAATEGRTSKADLEITLPERFDPAWAKDAMIEAAPGGVGRRAWWLSQLLAGTPLRTWTEQFCVNPAVIVRALRGHRLATPILDGWSAAAIDQGAGEWMPHLWDLWRRNGCKGLLVPQPQRALIAAMEPGDAAARICDLLGDGTLILELMEALPRPWPQGVAEMYLGALERWLDRLSGRRPQSGDPWAQSLQIAAVALPSTLLVRARSLREPADLRSRWYSDRWHRAFRNFSQALSLRQRLAEQIRR